MSTLAAHLVSALLAVSLATIVWVTVARARRRAQLERARHAALYRGVGEAVVVLDAKDVVVGWNPAAERIYGWTAAEALGRTGRDIVDPEPISDAQAAGDDSLRFEARHRRKDGQRIHVEVTGSYAPDPEHGKVFVLVVRDVTRQRETERALRESEERLSLALAGAQMTLWDWDLRTGRLVLGDEVARRSRLASVVTGTFDEILARLVHPEDRKGAAEKLAAVLRGAAEEFVSEHRGPGRGDSWTWVVVAGHVAGRDARGEPTRLTGTLRDVTAERNLRTRLERAERLTSLGTLAGGVAHEVNNPLAYVSANLAFLREELSGSQGPAASREELLQALAECVEGIGRVRETVTGLERFASPETTAPAPVDVRSEIEAALGLARHELTRRARLEVDLPAGLPRVMADGGSLRQLFLNLLVNAAQAVPEGKPDANRIAVSARLESGQVVVDVSDSGVGIPSHVMPRIFDPFFSTKPVGTGTGLGLSVCHGIVKGLGGSIEVESEPGRGARFRVLLPVVRVTPAHPIPAVRRARLLIVDDEPFVGRALSRILGSLHDVTVTLSPREALSWVERGDRWDLVLCDLMMPEMTGMELEARVARAAPEMVERFVFMTGGAFTRAARDFVESGRACIEKPVDPGALRELVARRVAAG